MSAKEGKRVKADAARSSRVALAALAADKLGSLHAEDFVIEDMPSDEVITSKQRLRAYFHHLAALPNVKFPDASFSEL